MKTLFTFFCILLSSAPISAQWVQTSGPEGIIITSSSSSTAGLVFMSHNGDLYRQNGTSWIKLASLASPGKLQVVDDVYFITKNQRTYRSADDGKTWTSVPVLGQITGSGNKLYNVANDSLSVSTDKGATWQFIDTVAFFTQSVIPNKNYLIGIVTGYDPQLLRSFDGGVEWTRVTTPPTMSDFNTFIVDIIIDGDQLYALMSTGEIYISTDDGDTWTKLLEAPTSTVGQYQRLIKAGNIFWVESAEGIYLWDGMAWGMPFSGYASLIAATAEEATIKTIDGLFRIYAKDDKLDLLTPDFLNTSVYGLTAINSTVYATGNGLHRSTDLGDTWTKVSSLSPYTIVADQTTLYSLAYEGLMRSTDDGLTWLPFATPRDEEWQDVTSVATDGSTLYLSYGKTFGEHGQSNWVSGGILRSEDHGATWQTINNGLPANIETHVPVHQIVVHEGALYAATLEGIFRSDNNGAFWVPFNSGIGFGNFRIGALITGGNKLYFSYANDYYQMEGGLWQKLPKIDTISATLGAYGGYTTALGDSLFVTTYTYDPATESATYKTSVYNGNVWADMNPPAPDGVVLNAFIRVGSTFMAGSMHHSVWRSSNTQSVIRPNSATDLSVYPNPAADKLYLHGSSSGIHSVTIYDMLGRAVIVNAQLMAGSAVNVSSLLSGTYALEIIDKSGLRHQLRFTKK